MKEKINFILHNLKNMFFYKKMKIFILIETKLYESRKKKKPLLYVRKTQYRLNGVIIDH